jgi:hypothetical protein
MTHQDESSAIRDLVDLAMEHGPDAKAAATAEILQERPFFQPFCRAAGVLYFPAEGRHGFRLNLGLS